MQDPIPKCSHEYNKDCYECLANMEALRDIFFYEPEYTLDALDPFDI